MRQIAFSELNYINEGIQLIKNKILNSVSTKHMTYHQLNNSLTHHSIYSSCDTFIKEYERISFSKFRLSAHKLKIETGRWARPIIPRIQRLCNCGIPGSIQDEIHVLTDCLYTAHIRNTYPNVNFSNLFNNNDNNVICSVSYKIMKIFENA